MMAFFARKRIIDHAGNENPYWMSFSDMMSGMLIIFILVCIALLYQLTQMRDNYAANMEELSKSIRVRYDIIHEIQKELAQKNIEVYISDNDTVLRIPEVVLHFDTNRHEIKNEHKETAEEIGRALYEAIAKDDRWEHLETVFVEGHTDSKQARDNPRYNWDLSAMRAISLWQYWLENTDFGPRLRDFRNKDNKRLFSVSGYADSRPVEGSISQNMREDDLRRQRRIDIRFTTRQPTFLEYEKAGRALESPTSKP